MSESGLRSLLDHAFENLRGASPVPDALRLLVSSLNDVVQPLEQEFVQSDIRPLCLSHPIRELLHEDPYTRRSFLQPRGYPGDAELLDYIYCLSSPTPLDSSLGTEIFAQHMASFACRNVRRRRALVAARLDALPPGSRVLSVGAGHFRESTWSRAVQSRALEVVAVDQDPASLAVVDRENQDLAVSTVRASVLDIIRRPARLGEFSFIYSAGLFDYLDDTLAGRLVSSLSRVLTAGGQLVIANFMPGLPERGYMETFMEWRLKYRTGAQLSALAARFISSDGFWADVHEDGGIAYLTLSSRRTSG